MHQTSYTPLGSRYPFVLHGLAEDQTVFQPIENTHEWEPHVIALLEQIVRPDFICLDIGANIGAITLPLAHLASKGHVYAFEASSETVRILEQNVEANQLTNVRIVQAAISSHTGDLIKIYTSPGQLGTAHQTVNLGKVGNVESVRTLALDDYPLKRVDLIKLDIEGAEIAALAGARRLIAQQRPMLVVEYNPAPAEWFAGSERHALYDVLAGLYPQISRIGEKGELEPIANWEQLAEILKVSAWCDLVCQ